MLHSLFIGKLHAFNAKYENKKPTNNDPESPIKIFAGELLKGKKDNREKQIKKDKMKSKK